MSQCFDACEPRRSTSAPVPAPGRRHLSSSRLGSIHLPTADMTEEGLSVTAETCAPDHGVTGVATKFEVVTSESDDSVYPARAEFDDSVYPATRHSSYSILDTDHYTSLGPASIETAIYYSPLDGAIWSALPVRTSSQPPLPRVSTTVTLSPASQSVAWAHSQGQAQSQALAEMKKAMMQDPVFRATRRVCFTSDIEGNHDQGTDRGIVGRTRSTPGSAVTVQQDAEIAALKPQLSGRESAKPLTAQPSSAHVLNTRIISM